ncbi:MAG TPA: hypothetical protein VF765_13390 [Polyangiaceae bacterium]
MIRTRLAFAAACTALAGLLTCACHEPEQPPVPPRPTNPTNAAFGAMVAEQELDASTIVREAGPVPPADAGIGLFDAAPVGPR